MQSVLTVTSASDLTATDEALHGVAIESSDSKSNPASAATDGLDDAQDGGDLPGLSAWASAVGDTDRTLAVTLPAPTTIDRVTVAGSSIGSVVTGLRDYDVEVAQPGGDFTVVARVRDKLANRAVQVAFSPVQAGRVRLHVLRAATTGFAGGDRPWFWPQQGVDQAVAFALEAYAGTGGPDVVDAAWLRPFGTRDTTGAPNPAPAPAPGCMARPTSRTRPPPPRPPAPGQGPPPPARAGPARLPSPRPSAHGGRWPPRRRRGARLPSQEHPLPSCSRPCSCCWRWCFAEPADGGTHPAAIDATVRRGKAADGLLRCATWPVECLSRATAYGSSTSGTSHG